MNKNYSKFQIPNSKIRVLAVCALCLLALSACSLKKTVVNSTALFMDDIMDGFFEEGDIVFAEAAIPANLKLLDGLIRGANYENDGLLLKGCKLYAMYAMGFMEDASLDKKADKENIKRASAFYERAKDYGLMVLKKNNDFKKAAEGSVDDFTQVMPAFGRDDVETLFWAAFAWGEYINLNRNNVSVIADLPKVKVMMERVIELNDKYFYGLPHLFMIVYYSMPKMFGGDYDKAKKEYETMQEISGGKFILADFFMARYYAVQVQDRKLFDELIGKVESADDGIITEKLFTQVAKKKAAVLKLKAGDLF
jgi:hypothetical protein